MAFLLGGLIAPTVGTVSATDALDVSPGGLGLSTSGRHPHRWRAPDLARRIGTVFQNPEHQFLTSRVDEELALGPRLAGGSPSSIAATVDDLLGRMRLAHVAAANPHTLSGGGTTQAGGGHSAGLRSPGVAARRADLLQDLRTWTELVDLLAKLRDDGRAIVTATHDADLVTALADRVHTVERPS